jgi:beta-glucanase (GH16 family)
VLGVLVGVAAMGSGATACVEGGEHRAREASASTHGTLIFQDNFSGKRLDTKKWSPYVSQGNGGNGLRRASAFRLDGKGKLVVTAQMINGTIVSGGMSTRRNFTYGRFALRVRTEPDPTGNMSGVVLTWPQSGNWPADGENDIYETGHAVDTRFPFHSFVHYGRTNEQHSFTHRANGARWHTIVMDWRRKALKIYRDGRLVWTLTDERAIPDVAHFLAIQLDAMTTRQLTRPVRMYVDYVRIYR